jgi:hypothetical protein
VRTSEAPPQTAETYEAAAGLGSLVCGVGFAPLRGAAVLTEQSLTQRRRFEAVKTASDGM